MVKDIGIQLEQNAMSAFHSFENALYEENKVMNLTRVPSDECYLRHFIDSLLMHDLIPTGSNVLDIGCGPGFPAWPLANARPDLSVTGLDSSGKMLGFLNKHLLPNLKTLLVRVEESQIREEYDVVTGRAVAPLAAQLEISAAACKIGGLVIPMRSTGDESDIHRIDPSCLGLAFESLVKRTLPVVNAERCFPVYRKVKSTPNRYPRRWSEIKKSPLFP